jgi:hypothetical protein
MESVEYPVFVLIWDDQSFMRVDSPSGLRWFEQPDLREGRYRAWDSCGREYCLRWCDESNTAQLVLEYACGLESFRVAIRDYARRLDALGIERALRRRCDPTELSAALKRMEEKSPRTSQDAEAETDN